MIDRKIIIDKFFEKPKMYQNVQHTHEQNKAEPCDRCNYDKREKSLDDWIQKTTKVPTRNPDTEKMEPKPILDVQVVRGRLNDVIGWAYSH